MPWHPIPSKYVGAEYPDKPQGWFSRRYKDGANHAAAVEGKSRRDRRERKNAEAEARNAVTPHDRTRAHRESRCLCERAS